MSRHRRVAIATVVALAAAVAASAAGAHPRWPVIGCWDFRDGYFNHYAWRYAPRGLCSITPTTEGIDHAHWSYWGRRQATANGDFVDDLGFQYPAKITVYDRHRTWNFLGGGTYAAWYAKMHVVARREFRGDIWRGPFNVFMNVSPQE